MRLLFPPSSIPCGLVRLNCLAWGLTLRLVIRKLWPWCSRFLIATQPNILYASLHVTPLYPVRFSPHNFPLVELSHVWLMISGFKSNLSPKVRLIKPVPLAFTAFFSPRRLWSMYSFYSSRCVSFWLVRKRWERCDPYLTLLSSHRT